MDTSTYFGLNLVTGSDKVNPLTVDRPNYEQIDEQMHKNQIASVVEATELKSGTVHAITCLTVGAVFFRFTATSDYTAGDTFTFNGTPVSAVLPDGSGLQQGAFKINGTVLCSIVGTLLTVYSFTASGIAADSEKLGGQLPAYYAKATDAISTYVHSRIGTVNNFVGTGANGKVKFAANIQPGDTVQINGQPVTAFCGSVDFLAAVAGLEIVGKTALFVYDGTAVTFAFDTDKNTSPFFNGDAIDLSLYSASTPYTTPVNGIVKVAASSQVGIGVICANLPAHGDSTNALIGTNGNNTYRTRIACFVPKGAKIYRSSTGTVPSGDGAWFFPFQN